MGPRFVIGALLAVVASFALACGGGGESEGDRSGSSIRTDSGFGLAPLALQSRDGVVGSTYEGRLPGAVPAVESEWAPAGGAGVSADLALYPGYYPVYPPQAGQNGITVQGFGSATAEADGAVVEMMFSITGGVEPMPMPAPESRGETRPVAPTPPGPITEEDLKPVIDAIRGQGVPAEDIEVVAGPKYGYGMGTIRVTVNDLGKLDSIVNAATSAAGSLADIALQNTGVAYTVRDCAGLEKAAMQAGVEDVRVRAGALAGVLGVNLGSVMGASHSTSSMYGGPTCGGSSTFPVPLASGPYVQGQPEEVQVIATLFVTYAIQ